MEGFLSKTTSDKIGEITCKCMTNCKAEATMTRLPLDGVSIIISVLSAGQVLQITCYALPASGIGQVIGISRWRKETEKVCWHITCKE